MPWALLAAAVEIPGQGPEGLVGYFPNCVCQGFSILISTIKLLDCPETRRKVKKQDLPPPPKVCRDPRSLEM